MVLILAAEWDPLALAVRDELDRRGREHTTLAESWARDSELAWTPLPFAGAMKLSGRRVELASLDGVLARHDMLMGLPTTPESPQDRYPIFESAAALLGILDALPCTVVNRPLPTPRSRSLLLDPAPARAAGFDPVPTLVTSSRDEALAAIGDEGSAALVGRVSHGAEDRVVGSRSEADEALDALLPHGAVLVKRLGPAPLMAAFVASDVVIGAAWSAKTGALEPRDLDPEAAELARSFARQLDVQLLRLTLQGSDGRLRLVDADPYPFMPSGPDRNLLPPVAAAIGDVLAP